MQAFWRLEVGMTDISVSPKPSHATGASRAVVIVRTLRLSFDQLQTTDPRLGLGAQSYCGLVSRVRVLAGPATKPTRSAHRISSLFIRHAAANAIFFTDHHGAAGGLPRCPRFWQVLSNSD